MRLDQASPPNDADRQVFPEQQLAEGWRLACRHSARAGQRVELPQGTLLLEQIDGDAVLGVDRREQVAPSLSSEDDIAIAVDIGTTSLQWRASRGDRIIVEGSEINPQMGAGSDVVSRLAAAATPEGLARLQGITLARLRHLTRESGRQAEAMCLAGNPAMTCIALGLNTRSLAVAPYSLPVSGGSWETLPGLPPVWIPPQLSPFVGGDISAGYAFLALNPARPAPRYPFLLSDLGTNGEFLLALDPTRALCASVALGPALEGTGLSRGTEARPGAIHAFSLSPRGLQAHCLPGGEGESPSPGITGTGYISLLRLLLHAGLVSREGRFAASGALGRLFQLDTLADTGEACLRLPLGMALTATDVEELLKVKAAFSLGMRRLLESAGLDTRLLARVYLAGALGLHVDKVALEELGFLPQGMAERVEAVGNSSLGGAALLLASEQRRDALVAWARGVASLDLAADAAFQQGFAEEMKFGW
jgi:uncharacterized 2Fe-2S/4Fe-4S cluster protein (DUF4445 family)